MARKRKTLPKDFEELLKSGDIQVIKKVFDKCDLEAYGGYGKSTAIGFDLCPDELVEWLVEQGADLHKEDEYGDSPLHRRARSRRSSIEILLKLGADVTINTKRSGTPLHVAARSKNVPNAKLLLQYGSNINEKDSSGMTPLERALEYCSNIDIVDMEELAKLFFEYNADKTDRMKEFVTNIGVTFEFHRAGFNKDSVEEFSDALSELYALFEVSPVPIRAMHDGKSEIVVISEKWQDQYSELWDSLIPSSGPAELVQGEVLRIAGRISDEVLRNGGINWDSDYKKMKKAFLTHIDSGESLSKNDIKEAKFVLSSMANIEDGADKLAQLAVKWICQNTKPIALVNPEYDR